MSPLTRPAARRIEQAIRAAGWARLGLGVVALTLPAAPARPWIGAAAGQPAAETLARALGGRDVALGLGTLLARGDGSDVGRWLAMSAIADASDVLATLIGWRSRPPLGRLAVLSAASGGALVCTALARWTPR